VICAPIVCALLACAPRASEGRLERVMELVRRQEYGAALEAARAETDPLSRAQGTLYVRHWAGDLDGALRAGAEGLARAPDDPWLNERMAYVELSLRRPRAALGYVDALERAASTAPESERARWLEIARGYRNEAEDLARGLVRRQRSLVRARVTSLVVLGGAAACIAFLALGRATNRNRPSDAWTR
jgi:hypothetical protein